MTAPYLDDEDLETRTELQQVVAGLLSDLSHSGETPIEVEACEPFDANEVDFDDEYWMGHLAAVQGWLRLDETLRQDSRQAFLESLARGLQIPSEQLAERGILTINGLEQLRERLERAVASRHFFMERLEEEGTIHTATRAWLEHVEESMPDLTTDAEVIDAKANTWSIFEFVHRAKQQKLDLSPSYQRGDVWPTSDARLLIESILRGIPLPSVILLKPSQGSSKYEVVDGKQRLTAILRFVGEHPVAIDKIKSYHDDDLLRLFRNDYPKFRTRWKNVTGEQLTETKEREYYFPFKLRSGEKVLTGNLAPLRGRYYTEIRDYEPRSDGISVSAIFEMTSDYKIPIIEYDKATPRQIHEVFHLYNKQGKHLNAEEIRNALYHRLPIMRSLLVTAGDSTDVEAVAPFLQQDWHRLSDVAGILDSYQFGNLRYRRTKVLGWIVSVLLAHPTDSAGKVVLRSTASHVNEWLRSLEDRGGWLATTRGATDVMRLAHQALVAHSGAPEAWAPGFRNAQHKLRWQELPLVGSVVGVALAAAVIGDDIEDRVLDQSEAIEDATGNLRRMRKTQTRDQWDYIARIAMAVLEVLGVDLQDAHTALGSRFGSSGVPVLRAALLPS